MPLRNFTLQKTFCIQQHHSLYGVNSTLKRITNAAHSFDGNLFNIGVLPLKNFLKSHILASITDFIVLQ